MLERLFMAIDGLGGCMIIVRDVSRELVNPATGSALVDSSGRTVPGRSSSWT